MTIAGDRNSRALAAQSLGMPMPGLSDGLHNLVITASAGCGKTFQLTNRYLRLLLAHADPGGILASTFTRLAAGEIRDRILERLAKAAASEADRAELARHLGAPLSRDAALDLLERLATDLHRLQVRTLDSFFSSIVRCFALELGLDPAADIVDEDTGLQLRREAIARMLDERDPQPLIDLLRVLTEGAAARSVTDEIDAQIVPLYELYREAPPEAWEAIDESPAPLTSEAYADAIDALHALAESAADRAHVKGDYFNHKTICKSFAKDLEWLGAAQHASPDDWIAFVGTGVACKIVKGEKEFCSRAIPTKVLETYGPFLGHAAGVVRRSLVHRTRSTRDLLARFHERYEEVKRERKALTFADLTYRVSTADAMGALDAVWFRLDAVLRHLLLDEMQDTNVQQWRALSSIVSETLAYVPPERTFFCVGDAKQSIYGWREASPEILESLPAALGIEPETLAKSWRSSKVIMDVVNRVFTDVAHNPTMSHCLEAARKWDAAFTPHETAKTDRPGHAALHVAPLAAEGEKQSIARLRHAADLVAKLHEQSPGRTIGVLTRRNKTVNRLLYELGPAGRNLPASGRGGGSLTDAPAVNAVLDLLRLADHCDHTVAAFNVAHSPLGEVVNLRPLADRRVDLIACRRASRRVRAELLGRGYASTIGRWIRAIGSKTDQRQLRRLIQLQRLAACYDRRATLRCVDFLAYVEATPVDDPASAPIHVMTIHQSKGLEFDIVLLPELDEEITKTNDLKILYERDAAEAAAGPVSRIARNMKKEAWDLLPDLAPLFHRQVERMARESLCVLYVAMTRAKHALHLVVNPPHKGERKKSLAAFVHGALAPERDREPNAIMFECGRADWHERGQPAQADEPADTAPIGVPIEFAPPPAGEGVAARRAASASEHSPKPLRDRLRLDDDQSRQRGTAIHAMFETIEWLDDWTADRDRLASIARTVAPRRGSEWAEKVAREFLAMLDRPVVRDTLSRPTSRAEVLLRRERPYARIVDGAVQRGFIDRLTATVENGICTGAIVLDYKTDRVEAGEAESHAAIYREQLRTYRAAAAEELDIDPERIAMKLLFVQCGTVVTL